MNAQQSGGEGSGSDIHTLVVHVGGIGDLLLACPAIAQLQKESPVTLAGHPERLSLAVAAGAAQNAIDLTRIDFQSIFASPSETFITALQDCHRAVIWMADPDHTIAQAFELAEVPDVCVFPGLPPAAWTRHASDYYTHCLNMPDQPPLQFTPEPIGPPLDIVIHPGSGSTTKNTPLEEMIALAASLHEAGRTITWCLGPAEQERLSANEIVALKSTVPDNSEPILETDNLVHLAQRLATARAYIGNDSGITHLAAALGIPSIALFCATNPKVWAPQGRHVTIITEDWTHHDILKHVE